MPNAPRTRPIARHVVAIALTVALVSAGCGSQPDHTASSSVPDTAHPTPATEAPTPIYDDTGPDRCFDLADRHQAAFQEWLGLLEMTYPSDGPVITSSVRVEWQQLRTDFVDVRTHLVAARCPDADGRLEVIDTMLVSIDNHLDDIDRFLEWQESLGPGGNR